MMGNGRFTKTSAPKNPLSGFWYHGDSAKRHGFEDQRMDRDPHQDRNAVGPGIYFTRDLSQANGYASPHGYVYTARLRPRTRVLPEKRRASYDEILEFIRLAPEESRETGATNYDMDPARGELKAAEQNLRYATKGLHDALMGIYNDFYGRDAEAFAQSMVKLGYDVLLHHLPAVDHLVVWNPDVLEIVSEEPYAETP